MFKSLKRVFVGAAFAALATTAIAKDFNIPDGDLGPALSAYMAQSGAVLVISADAMRGVRTKGVKGDLSPEAALVRILSGTGFVAQSDSGVVEIVRRTSAAGDDLPLTHTAAAAAPMVSGAALETVTVTSSKIGGDVQNIPISITAMSQEQLTATQTAGGPDLVKQVPNMTFTKTNFSGYSIQIRGIGTQAISVTTDPAVAVAFNDIPFIRNHFFEQEFYDVAQVEVLRGPQGTLYGRNATAGVVNLTSAKPSDQFEAMVSGELGNYHQRRLEGMINIPVVDDRLDIRVAGEWTKRQGYSFNALTDERIDGRDLWSGRVTIGLKPIEKMQMYLVWEHFSEDDDRMRSSKQLCKRDPGPAEILGIPVPQSSYSAAGNFYSQGCLPASPYSPDAYEVPNGFSLAYVTAMYASNYGASDRLDVYASTTQSRNLRVIESAVNPSYRVKNDIVELNADYAVTPALTFTSQTGFNHDFLWGVEDYNRFNTQPGVFAPSTCCSSPDQAHDSGNGYSQVSAAGVFCDPQVGCSDRIVAEDLSTEHAWQLGQEFRLASNFAGPFNFSAGGNYLHYETEESYYVFINAITLFMSGPTGSANFFPPSYRWVPGVSDNHQCLQNGFRLNDPTKPTGNGLQSCGYIDPNPIGSLNNEGHNYFLSQNPYTLNSYAGFGEAYYNVLSDLKLTTGLRWTEDRKHFPLIPSWVAGAGYGYPIAGVVDQQWDQFTGRVNATWTPKLSFTDQSMFYGSYAHGYKAGGANPPGGQFLDGSIQPIHPLTFKPEFVDAFELGAKNTLLDGSLTINASAFYYNYENYQISEIVDRTAINLNFDTHVKGAELESTWEPVPGLRFNFAGGWEDTSVAKGSSAVDLIDRTAGDPAWMLQKPDLTQASNCIMPVYVIEAYFRRGVVGPVTHLNGDTATFCENAYLLHLDPITGLPYVPNPTVQCTGLSQTGKCGGIEPLNVSDYPGFDPNAAPNKGAGISKDLSGNELPNAPPFTVSVGAQYSLPLTPDWAGTARGDFYWQDDSWGRIFNDTPYDRLHGYANLNLTLIFTSQTGWQVMLFDKNVFDTTAITGTFLNSDDSGLTTNVFLTDPKLIGIRVTKNW